MKNNSQFANRDNYKAIDLENFSKILSGKKKILTKKEQYEFEANYMAMCLLLPKDSFLQIVEALGGLSKVNSYYEAKAALARVFNVEYKLVEIRIDDLLSQININNNMKNLTCKDCIKYGDTHSSCFKSKDFAVNSNSPACEDIKPYKSQENILSLKKGIKKYKRKV